MTAKANETTASLGAPPAAGSGSLEGTPVSLRNLTRAFGATKALDGMSLDIAPGELVALLGPSGCGKTTALRIVAGFEFADSGEVLVNGRDVSGIPAARRDMGMAFQSYSLFPNMSALDNVGFGLRIDKETELTARQPVISLSPRGRIVGIRSNERSMRPPAEEAFFPALRVGGTARPAGVHAAAVAGDCLIMDNTRVLHARTAFAAAASSAPSPSEQERHLRGCCADLDGLLSTLAVLSRPQ
jgi:ABC-type sugar transport system ATPase subunit